MTLQIDSFEPRNMSNICTDIDQMHTMVFTRAQDAYDAHSYLLRLDLVDSGSLILFNPANRWGNRISNWKREQYQLRIDSVFKYLYCINEAAISHRNDQIDRIEVLLAVKASCQIGFMVRGRMKVVAQRASEPE